MLKLESKLNNYIFGRDLLKISKKYKINIFSYYKIIILDKEKDLNDNIYYENCTFIYINNNNDILNKIIIKDNILNNINLIFFINNNKLENLYSDIWKTKLKNINFIQNNLLYNNESLLYLPEMVFIEKNPKNKLFLKFDCFNYSYTSEQKINISSQSTTVFLKSGFHIVDEAEIRNIKIEELN